MFADMCHVATYLAKNENNCSDVVVSVIGTSKTTVTDNSGHWQLHNLPNEPVVYSFSKNGYVSTQECESTETLSEDIGVVNLYWKPFHNMEFAAALVPDVAPDEFVLKIDGKLFGQASEFHFFTVQLFVGSTNCVSKNNGTYFDTFQLTNTQFTDSVHFAARYPIRIVSPGFDTSGTKYYLTAYGVSGSSWGARRACETDSLFFDNLGDSRSSIVEVILP